MELASDAQDMARKLAAFERAHWDSLPERVREVIDENRGGSPVDLFCRAAEALWANRDKLKNKASRILLAQLAQLCDANGWQRLRGGRGGRMLAAMMRENGEEPLAGTRWPDPKDDPESDPLYAPPPPPPELSAAPEE